MLLKTGEVAKRLGVKPRTVLTWAEKGWLPTVRTPGGHRRYPAEGVEQAQAKMNQPGN